MLTNPKLYANCDKFINFVWDLSHNTNWPPRKKIKWYNQESFANYVWMDIASFPSKSHSIHNILQIIFFLTLEAASSTLFHGIYYQSWLVRAMLLSIHSFTPSPAPWQSVYSKASSQSKMYSIWLSSEKWVMRTFHLSPSPTLTWQNICQMLSSTLNVCLWDSQFVSMALWNG